LSERKEKGGRKEEKTAGKWGNAKREKRRAQSVGTKKKTAFNENPGT
jgi:hypothetical protein